MGGRWMVVNIFIIIMIVSRNGTFEKRFSMSREDIIPLVGLWVLRISINSCV